MEIARQPKATCNATMLLVAVVSHCGIRCTIPAEQGKADPSFFQSQKLQPPDLTESHWPNNLYRHPKHAAGNRSGL